MSSNYSNRGGAGGGGYRGGRGYDSSHYYYSRGRGSSRGYYKGYAPYRRGGSYGGARRGGFNNAVPGEYYNDEEVNGQFYPTDAPYYDGHGLDLDRGNVESQQQQAPVEDNQHNTSIEEQSNITDPQQQQVQQAQIETPPQVQSQPPASHFNDRDSYNYKGDYGYHRGSYSGRRGNYRGGFRGSSSSGYYDQEYYYSQPQSGYEANRYARYSQGRAPPSNGFYSKDRSTYREETLNQEDDRSIPRDDEHQQIQQQNHHSHLQHDSIEGEQQIIRAGKQHNNSISKGPVIDENHWVTRLTLPSDLKSSFGKMFTDLENHNENLMKLSEKRLAIELEVQKFTRLSKSEELKCQLTEEKIEAINFI